MTSAPTLDGRRILVVVPPARFDEAAFYQTWQMLSDEGAWLTLASDSATGMAVGEDGNVAQIATQVKSASLGEFDAIVVIGGPEAELLPKVAGLTSLLERAKDHRLPVGALAGAERAFSGVIGGSVRNLPRFIAELAVEVSRNAPVRDHSGLQMPV